MAWDGQMPDFKEYGGQLALCLLLFGVFDFVYAHRSKARYFAIHVLANSIVVATTLPSMWFMLSDPANAIQSSRYSSMALCSNLAIHIYHMTMFDNLVWIDWLHHGLMTGESESWMTSLYCGTFPFSMKKL